MLGFALLLACVLPLTGCAIANGFTGGGVPIGKALLMGRAVSALDTQRVIPNARVKVIILTEGRDVASFETTTSATGEFRLADLPVGEKTATVRVGITPTNSLLRAQSIGFILSKDQTAHLSFALVPNTYPIDQVTSFNLQPSNLALQPNAPNKITAQVLDGNGNVLPLVPTTLLIGNFTSVEPDGNLVTSSPGTAVLQVFWYNDIQTTALVTVSNDVSTPPPPPRHASPSAH